MDCASALERLSARLDGELAPAERALLDRHFEHCPACQSADHQLRQLDGLCRTGLTQPAIAARIAEAVVQDFAPAAVLSVQGSRMGRWSVLVAAAASLAAAVLILLIAPQRGGSVHQVATPTPGSNTLPAIPLFEVGLVLGNVEARPSPFDDWKPAAATQPIGSRLRTAEDSLCVFSCPEGSVIRLDAKSEVELTAVNALTMRRGRLWCQAAGDSALRIVCEQEAPAYEFAAEMRCQPASEVQTEITAPASLSIFSAGGTVDVLADGRQLTVTEGQMLELTPESETIHSVYDVNLQTAWMIPLLAARDRRSPEVHRQISGILASIGEAKASYLYRDQLVQLGGAGAIPLIEYLRSTADATDQARQRTTAAEIISQTAPDEAIPELIELLADREAGVRIAAATALERLTGLTQGVSPEDWKTLGPQQLGALEKWRSWLKSTSRLPT